MNDDWILGIGPGNAKLVVVGEAGGKHEEIARKPFVGPSGELLTELLENGGVSRSSVYITNVVKIRPPNNILDDLGKILNPQTNEGYKVGDFLPLLWNEIEAIQPNCILAMGALATRVLTGKEGIKNWRGSILPLCNFTNGSSSQYIKVIPTIHPAALFERQRDKHSGEGMFSWKQKCHIQFDVIKAVRESKFPEFDIPRRTIEIVRSSLDLERFFNLYRDYKKVYVDVEVYKAHLVCIGFAFTPTHGISVPLIDLQSNDNPKGIALHELTEIWRIVYEKLEELEIIGQNFKADKVYWLEKAGFNIPKFKADTMFKMHTVSPELPKSLAFQASVLTNEPFYKFEGKEYNPHKDKLDVLLRYNGRDCVVNCECDQELDKELEELGLTDFFNNFVMKCYPIYEKMEKRGWRIDKEKREWLIKQYDELIVRKEVELAALLLEFGLVYEKGLNYDSPQQVSKLIYGILRCPQRKDTRDETLTALMNNAVKDKRKKAIINCILECRSIGKEKGTYAQARVDFDGRMRYTYNQVGTETGRTSTSIIKKPLRNGKWGVAVQTNPRANESSFNIRSMYIADPGKILIEFDQSQAEARIVALLANDLELLELFDILPKIQPGGDIHKLTASFIYGLSGSWSGPELMRAAINQYKGIYSFDAPRIDFSFLDLVDDHQRQIGKNSRHGLGYNLGEEGLSIKMKISLYRAKTAFQKVHEMSPNIAGVFHRDIQDALLENNRTFKTPFGRLRIFYNKWGNELFREAYAHIPQSTIGDNTKRCLLGIEEVDWIEVLAEMHDGFVAQIPMGREKECYEIVKPIFEQPIDFERCTLSRPPIVIPVDAKIGLNWGELKKYKGE